MPLVQKGRQTGLQLEEKQVGKICMNSSHTETLVRGFTHGVQMRNGGPKGLCPAHDCSLART